MSLIVLDCETIPGKADWIKEDIAASIQPPGNIKKQETLDKWYEEKKPLLMDEKYHKCGLDAATGEILCIGMQIDDESPGVIDGFHLEGGLSERVVLLDFVTLLEDTYRRDRRAPTFAGHNIIAFDLPYIWRRCMVHGIELPRWYPTPSELKPWSDTVFDTMIAWAGQRGSISLDKLCKALGIQGKDGIDGSMVYQMYLDGKLDEISEYCLDDVRMTKAVVDRLR